jgi:hypothetical protein
MAKKSKKKKSSSASAAKSLVPLPEVLPDQPPAPIWRLVLQALTIVAAVFWIYWPVVHGDWLWDDDYLISQSPLVQDPDGLWNVWFNPTSLIDYFPLTVSVEWLEWQMWPNNTFCYHLTSIVLHACSSLLVWYLFRKLGLRLAWVGGLLFAVHPVMVESVAWMAELKNTLSMPPFLLACCVWIDYERRGRREDYLVALGLFLIAMLCKTTMVMFPVVILFYAWWRRNRVTWTDLKHSLPFFAISLAVGLTLVALLRHGIGEETIPLGGFLSRLACGGLSISFYFARCFLPIEMLPIYPQWTVDPPTPMQLLPWPLLAGAIYWLWKKRQAWARNVLFALGFFIINLLPFVGFHIISFMRFTWVMDHILYLPFLGLLGLAVAGMSRLDTLLSPSTRPIRIGTLSVLLVVLAFGSHQYSKVFRNQVTLWTYMIECRPDTWVAYNTRGLALANKGRVVEAQRDYRMALRINPGYPEAHNNFGIVLFNQGRWAEAIEQFQLALKYCPEMASAQSNLENAQTAVLANPPRR